jgi:hypothetical protein
VRVGIRPVQPQQCFSVMEAVCVAVRGQVVRASWRAAGGVSAAVRKVRVCVLSPPQFAAVRGRA